MKRSTAVFIFLVGMVAGAAALRLMWRLYPPGPPRPEEIVQRLSGDLDLDDAQRAKLKEIFVSQAEKMEAFQKQTRKGFEALKDANDARIDAILRPDQKTKFEALKKKFRERRAHWGAMPFPPPPPPER
jgi:Spy/CpxP family protein refolding chaperone